MANLGNVQKLLKGTCLLVKLNMLWSGFMIAYPRTSFQIMVMEMRATLAAFKIFYEKWLILVAQ